MKLLQNIQSVLITTLLVVSTLTTLSGQLTLVDDQDLQIEGTILEPSISANIYMAVGDDEIGEFYWELLRSEDIPEEWQFSICDLVTCYNFGIETCPIDKPNLIAETADTIFFSVYLNNLGVEGAGDVQLRLWPRGSINTTLIEPILTYDVQFASSTIDTEVVTAISVTPNPVADLLSIQMELSKSNTVQLEVLNGIGQVVSSQTVTVADGMNLVTFDTSQYSNGMYSVVTRSDAGITTTQFVVSK